MTTLSFLVPILALVNLCLCIAYARCEAVDE